MVAQPDTSATIERRFQITMDVDDPRLTQRNRRVSLLVALTILSSAGQTIDSKQVLALAGEIEAWISRQDPIAQPEG